MFNLFKNKPFLASEDQTFQIETYRWLLRNFGGEDFYQATSLILPTKAYFPAEADNPESAAIATFNSVKQHANMATWKCILEAQQEDANPFVSAGIAIQNAPVSPNGTFQATASDKVIITYNPVLVGQPMQLVATLAHELAHYLTATAKDEPPGGWDNWEFATDIAATFMGFGIFMANSAFNFSQYADTDSQGWKSSRSGYLSENEHIYALAIFLLLKDLPINEASRYLKPHLGKQLKKAMKLLSNSDFIIKLKAVQKNAT
ncbi:hypothetical protein [Thalassotalea montiporae]